MRGAGEDVQSGGDAGPFQGQVGEDAVFRRADDVVFAVDQEDRRRLRGYLQPGDRSSLSLGLK